MSKSIFIALLLMLLLVTAQSQPLRNAGSNHGNRFEQLDYLLQDPNEYRTASGAPGPKYWQQRADYDINVDINEEANLLTGTETVTYFNNSPDILTYIWLQEMKTSITPTVTTITTSSPAWVQGLHTSSCCR